MDNSLLFRAASRLENRPSSIVLAEAIRSANFYWARDARVRRRLPSLTNGQDMTMPSSHESAQ
jgi:hypothetical protein